MKKLYIILIIIFLVILSVAGYLIYRYNTDRFFLREGININCVSGHSMGSTIEDGKTYLGFKAKPIENDIISFKCSAERCLKWGDNFTTDGHFAKRLIKIREDGAYWVDGDNKENSFDSDWFGWLLPSEISDVWVIKL